MTLLALNCCHLTIENTGLQIDLIKPQQPGCLLQVRHSSVIALYIQLMKSGSRRFACLQIDFNLQLQYSVTKKQHPAKKSIVNMHADLF